MKKPAIFKLYNYTKTGTDLMDQRMGRRKYSTKAKSNKWTMVGFYYLLDTARINSINKRPFGLLTTIKIHEQAIAMSSE